VNPHSSTKCTFLSFDSPYHQLLHSVWKPRVGILGHEEACLVVSLLADLERRVAVFHVLRQGQDGDEGGRTDTK